MVLLLLVDLCHFGTLCRVTWISAATVTLGPGKTPMSHFKRLCSYIHFKYDRDSSLFLTEYVCVRGTHVNLEDMLGKAQSPRGG